VISDDVNRTANEPFQEVFGIHEHKGIVLVANLRDFSDKTK